MCCYQDEQSVLAEALYSGADTQAVPSDVDDDGDDDEGPSGDDEACLAICCDVCDML